MSELKDMTADELEDLHFDMECHRDELEEQMADIKMQLEHAAATYNTTGVEADPEWFVNARTALRHKGREHQKLLRESGRVGRLLKQHDSDNRLREAVKAVVSEEQWEEIRQLCMRGH